MRVFSEHRDRLMAFRIRSRREVETLLAGYGALTDAGRDGVAGIAAFVDTAAERLGAIRVALHEDRYDSLDALDPLPGSPNQFIQDEIARLDAEIAELENAERDEAALVRLQARHTELADQKRLSEEIELVVERRNRFLRLRAHRLAQARPTRRGDRASRSIAPRQPTGSPEGPPQRTVEHPDQRSVADLFRGAGRKPWPGQRGNCRLPSVRRHVMMRDPIHPGETLREDLDVLGMSAAEGGTGPAHRGSGEPHHRNPQRPPRGHR